MGPLILLFWGPDVEPNNKFQSLNIQKLHRFAQYKFSSLTLLIILSIKFRQKTQQIYVVKDVRLKNCCTMLFQRYFPIKHLKCFQKCQQKVPSKTECTYSTVKMLELLACHRTPDIRWFTSLNVTQLYFLYELRLNHLRTGDILDPLLLLPNTVPISRWPMHSETSPVCKDYSTQELASSFPGSSITLTSGNGLNSVTVGLIQQFSQVLYLKLKLPHSHTQLSGHLSTECLSVLLFNSKRWFFSNIISFST